MKHVYAVPVVLSDVRKITRYAVMKSVLLMVRMYISEIMLTRVSLPAKIPCNAPAKNVKNAAACIHRQALPIVLRHSAVTVTTTIRGKAIWPRATAKGSGHGPLAR